MSDIPHITQRIVRVVIRFGGSSGDAAQAAGCSKHHVLRLARQMGLSFSNFSKQQVISRAKQILGEGA